jgi:hypothetical protein
MPLISNFNRKGVMFNNEMFNLDLDKMEIYNSRTRVTVDVNFIKKNMSPAYAISIYKAQGMTLNNYYIFDIDFMKKRGFTKAIYVAITRGKCKIITNFKINGDLVRFYKIEVSGKVYIGSTRMSLDDRLKLHKENPVNSKMTDLRDAKIYLLEECFIHRDDRMDLEEYYIRKFDSVNNGLNIKYRT